jgi:hypothetical protein
MRAEALHLTYSTAGGNIKKVLYPYDFKHL